VDWVRLDHFRGFQAYWAVPAGAETAAEGEWMHGPGAGILEAVRDALGRLPLLAEDLGIITPEVEALRDRFELPGMRVLQFAFGDDAKANDYLPYSYIHHCLVYTGTHDNDTTVGWFRGSAGATTQSLEEKAAEREFVLRYVGTSGAEIHWDLIRVALASVADTVIIPLQDVLGLDSSARMNVPGRPTGNWDWRFRPGQIDRLARARLADLTAVYSRWNGPIPDHLHQCPPRRQAKNGEKPS
jgi:4-alpha-glucanotransferase